MIDYLQRTQDLDNLITVIHNLSQMKTGSTFAINGQWGCSKTFLLNLLEEKLKANCNDKSYYAGEAYHKLGDHPIARIIWYQKGWALSQNPVLAPRDLDSTIRVPYICSYAKSIKEADELMRKFTQLSRVIE